jgi:restriction system protein
MAAAIGGAGCATGAMAKNNWKAPVFTQQEQLSILSNDSEGNSMIVDIEQPSRDQLAKFIERKFKGHRMAVLIEAILKANGYHTHRSPDGPDKGVDILAGKDSLGFGSPKICVQVKTTDEAVDRPTLDQLIGVMRNMNADYGLLVSWSGFKSSVIK